MEKSLKLRLHSNGNWSNLDDNGGDKLGFELENNATTIKIQLPDETSNFSHYLEVELPDGTVLLSSAIEEQLVDSIRTLVIPVGYPLTAQFGRVRIQYVGRKTNETIRSKVLPLDIDESVDGFVAGNSNPDFISWTEQHINDLTTRVTALEEGEAAEVHAHEEFGTDEVIVVADGSTGKNLKAGSKTIAQVLAAAGSDASSKDAALKIEVEGYTDAQVGSEKTRAEAVESAQAGRITTLEEKATNHESRIAELENGESAEVHADSAFGTNEIILVADGTGKKIKAGTKTIAQILALITAEATARDTAITSAVGSEKALREAADTALGNRIDALGLSSFKSVSVSGAGVTLADLETQINAINLRGEHVFFDLHEYADRAYICTVTFSTVNNIKYCFIEDIINNKTYTCYTGIDGTEFIADYVNDNVTDKLQIVRITDEEMTFGEVKAILDKINSIGNHVLFDVSALGAGAYLCAIFISGLPYKLFDIVSGKLATGVYDPEEPIINILTATKDVATKDQINDLQAQIDEIAGSSIIYGIRFAGNSTSGTRLVSAEGLQFDLSEGINDFAARPLFSDIYEVELDSRDSSGNIISGAPKQKFIHFPNFYFKKTKTLDGSSNIIESWYVSPIAVSGYTPIFKNADGTIPSAFLVGKYETAFNDDTEALVGSFTGKKPVVSVDRNWVQARGAYVLDEALGISSLQRIDQSFPKQAWDAIAILITIVTGSRNHQSTFKGITEDYLFNPADAANVGNQATSAANYVVIPSDNYIVTNSSVGSKITIYSSNTASRRWTEHVITAITANTPSAGLTKIEFDGIATIFNAGTVRVGLHCGELTGTTDSIVGDFGNLATNNRSAFKAFGIENYFGNFWTILGGAAIKEIWNSTEGVAENHLILPEGSDYTVGSDYSAYLDTEKKLPINDGYVKEVEFEGAVLYPTVTTGGSSSTYFSDYYYQDHKSAAGDPAYKCFLAGGGFGYGSSAGSFSFLCLGGWAVGFWYSGFRSFILIQ